MGTIFLNRPRGIKMSKIPRFLLFVIIVIKRKRMQKTGDFVVYIVTFMVVNLWY